MPLRSVKQLSSVARIAIACLAQMTDRALRTVVIAPAIALLVSLSMLYFVMRPLRRAFRDAVTIAEGLARGDVNGLGGSASNDELGQVSAAFREMIQYQQRMASVADALVIGDFSNEVVPVSQDDRLGVAFAHMSGNPNRLVQQLEASAMTDCLTQLGNRRAFEVRMRNEVSRAARHDGQVWLALVDIDNFNSVNDDNGHQHGDMARARLRLRGLQIGRRKRLSVGR